MGLREGLVLCLDIQALAVEVELDSRDLLLQLPQVKVSHCFREANFCADPLAKLGASASDGGACLDSPPPSLLLTLLLFDCLGLYHNRLCPNVCEAVSS